MTLNETVWIVARLCLVAMFPLSAIDKIWHWKNSLAQTNSGGLPGGPALLVLAILVEGLTPICIVTGWLDRPAAALLAGFCVVTAFLYHPFWAYPDFFSPNDDSKSREHFWQFVKNLTGSPSPALVHSRRAQSRSAGWQRSSVAGLSALPPRITPASIIAFV